MKRIQHMPPILNTVSWENLEDKNVYFWYYQKENVNPCRNTCENIDDAMAKLRRAEKAGFEAYVSCYVPVNKQHGVVGMTPNGRLHDIFFSKKYREVKEAYESCIGETQTASRKEVSVQRISNAGDKEKDTRLACRVVFPRYDADGKIIGHSSNKYTYKCRQWHLKGEHVTVKTDDDDEELKVVVVVDTFTTTERELNKLAEELGYKEIKELYCEEAIDLTKYDGESIWQR